jgi:SAM-dependent methyltransferase
MNDTPGRYDLLEEGRIVREQLAESPAIVARAREIASSAILGKVLLALSDCGFYEYVRAQPRFSTKDAVATLGLDATVAEALFSYLTGHDCLVANAPGVLEVTSRGREVFNAYTRGVVNMYVGAYAAIFENLSNVLRGKIPLGAPELARSPVHTAAGTSFLTCGFTIPEVIRRMDSRGARHVLDLGCGTGDFLVQYLRRNTSARGLGIDSEEGPLIEGRRAARLHGLEARLVFHRATVRRTGVDVPSALASGVDSVTSMYMLHELGRDGRDAIVDTARALKRALPGRVLYALEVEGVSPERFAASSDHKGRLDYWLLHVLSRQGLPREVGDWCKTFEDAGCKVLSEPVKTGGSFLYEVQL